MTSVQRPKGKAMIVPTAIITLGLAIIGLLAQGSYKTGQMKNIQDCNSLSIQELQVNVDLIEKNLPNDLDNRLRGIENNIARILEKLDKHDH